MRACCRRFGIFRGRDFGLRIWISDFSFGVKDFVDLFIFLGFGFWDLYLAYIFQGTER